METELVQIQMPKLPDGWKYNTEYRKPKLGEFFMYCGEVHESRGRQALAYPIVIRTD